MTAPYSPTGNSYLALEIAPPSTEVSGNGYARQLLGSSNWSLSNGVYTYTSTIPFGSPTGSWGTITGVAVYDSLTGGNRLSWGYLNPPQAPVIGSPFTLDANSVQIVPEVIQGPAGVQGSQGPQGAAGNQGVQGLQGPQGSSGVVAATAPITYDTGTQTVGLSTSGVTQGSYTNANITVDNYGRVTVASNGTGGGGTPGGSSGQVQYNASGAFAGAAALTYATSGDLVTTTAQAATDVPLTVKGATSQSANLTEWESSTGSIVLAVDPSGYLFEGTTPLLHTHASGRLGTSVFVGPNAGNLTSTSTYDSNTGLGDHALNGLTTGYQNTALGGYAGAAISSGHDNTLIGQGAGQSITTGYSNVAVGSGCLQNCTTGYYNVAIGLNSLPSVVDGSSVIGIGYGALAGATTISQSVCIGSGYGSASSVTQSVCVGYGNFGSETGGQQLIAVGNLIARLGTTNQGVIGIGYANWYNCTSYTNSISIGNQACLNRNGGHCVVIGDNACNPAGATLSGDNCVFIGASSGSGTTDNVTNSIALGYNAQVTASNTCQIGDVGANAVNVKTAGTIATGNSTTASRPTTTVGAMWFDTTLGIPIWFNGTNWINASGTTV